MKRPILPFGGQPGQTAKYRWNSPGGNSPTGLAQILTMKRMSNGNLRKIAFPMNKGYLRGGFLGVPMLEKGLQKVNNCLWVAKVSRVQG